MSEDQQPTERSAIPDQRTARVSRRHALGLVGAGIVGVTGASSVGGYAVGRTHERRRVQAVETAVKAAVPVAPRS